MIPIKNGDKKDYRYLGINYIPISQGKLLSAVQGVFSPEECSRIIAYSERLGYKTASLFTDNGGREHYYKDIRNSLRTMTDDPNFAQILEQRIRHAIPEFYKGRRYHSMNERLRFLKYDGSGHFQRHTDGQYSDEKRISLITVLIYLNAGYKGGFTTFYPDSASTKGFTLEPMTGMVCLMDQDISHEVPPLLSGVKYVIRTELMYNL